MRSSRTPFAYIFAGELHGRLVWFSVLRWIAVAGLTAASLVGPALGWLAAWPSLAVVAGFVAAYNLVFWVRLRRVRLEPPYGNLRATAIALMVMDLAALLVIVHFTGGPASPLIPFVVFHMAIGTIMISTRIMYAIAAVTCAGAFALFLADRHSALAVTRVEGVVPSWVVTTLMLIVLVFGVVYLTDSVTSRFKERNIELHRTTTALAERTEELQRLLREREEIEAKKSHYMRISAHQLRSPLGTIKTSLQVLTEGYLDPGSAEGRSLLQGAVARADSLLEIVNDLLELAKVREGRAKAPWTRNVSVVQILADIFDATDPYASERKVELVPNFIKAGAATLDWAVPPDLVYALENLIHNGIKYSKPAGGRVTVDLEVAGEAVTVVVADEGIGIPHDQREAVFLEFVRAPNAKHHSPEGTGLGLSIAREAIRMHGGEVALDSEEGVGSRFVVSLPLHYVPPEVEQMLQRGNSAVRLRNG